MWRAGVVAVVAAAGMGATLYRTLRSHFRALLLKSKDDHEFAARCEAHFAAQSQTCRLLFEQLEPHIVSELERLLPFRTVPEGLGPDERAAFVRSMIQNAFEYTLLFAYSTALVDLISCCQMFVVGRFMSLQQQDASLSLPPRVTEHFLELPHHVVRTCMGAIRSQVAAALSSALAETPATASVSHEDLVRLLASVRSRIDVTESAVERTALKLAADQLLERFDVSGSGAGPAAADSVVGRSGPAERAAARDVGVLRQLLDAMRSVIASPDFHFLFLSTLDALMERVTDKLLELVFPEAVAGATAAATAASSTPQSAPSAPQRAHLLRVLVPLRKAARTTIGHVDRLAIAPLADAFFALVFAHD